jgi:cytochrome c oxidase subunit 4
MRREYVRYLWSWLALMLLLTLTAGSAYLHLGAWNFVVNIVIAIAKAGLVATLFMHLKSSSGLIRIYAGIGLYMLALLFVVSASDYATRQVHSAPWQEPHQTMAITQSKQEK